MSKILALNDVVELTWWDEYDSKKFVDVELSEFSNGIRDERHIRVGELTLSVDAWRSLINYLELSVLDLDDQERFIEKYRTIHE